MSNLASQLTEIFKAGLQANPDLAKSLASAAQDDLGTGGKQTKAEANYRTADGSESCSGCQHFDGSSSCDIVSGNISPNGVSDNYEPAESAQSESSSDGQSSGSSDTGPKSDAQDSSSSKSEDG